MVSVLRKILRRDVVMNAAHHVAKAQLKLKGVTYSQLVEKLAEIGVDEKEANIRNKLSRGKFSAAFMLQCLSAIGLSHLQLV